MANRLASSSSPYLRQHRENPVDWHEWGDEAFAEAQRRDVPVLLSIGYSACHWCHVMAHESFESAEVAEVMNGGFVCVKVDREERPDVDAIYMDAVQAMTGRGGWPMTVFLAPDGRPFYGGTYYPRETFLRLMAAVSEAWRDRRDDVRSNAEALTEAVREAGSIPALSSPGEPGASPDADLLAHLTETLISRFDGDWGGFGGAPKFPPTFALEHLMRRWLDTAEPAIEAAVVLTLDAMAAGGIHDHIGGGFSRYSVDERWLVPHFEKMLYDQAAINRCYLHAWQIFGHDRHLAVLRRSVGYLLDVLAAPEGGFYCAEDADSLDADGRSVEGAFYTWTPSEVADVLGPDAPAACSFWGITDRGNFEGRSIPNRMHGESFDDPDPSVESLRARLVTARARRPRPGLDDKILTEWTAMTVSMLAEAAAAVDEPRWHDAAVAGAEFLTARMRRSDGRWLRNWHRDGEEDSRQLATAHDIAHVIDAFVRTYELTGAAIWIARAVESARELIDRHWDEDDRAFFTVADDGERLVVRAKDYLDNATPSANSVAALALARLAALVDVPEFRAIADAVIDRLADVSRRAPSATCHLALSRHLRLRGITEVVVGGARADMLAEVRRTWRPDVVLAWGERFDSPLWSGRDDDRAYVCRGNVCLAPSSTTDELRVALRASIPSR